MERGMGCLVLTLALVGALSACVSTGQMNGRLAVPGQPVAPVTFKFVSDRLGAGGTLSTTLPGGESFSGKYLQVTSTTTADVVEPFFVGWGPYWGDWGPFGEPWVEGGDHMAFRTNYSGKVVATLFGDKGNTMRCRFRLSDPPSGLSGGGIGECQLSKGGGKIDVQF